MPPTPIAEPTLAVRGLTVDFPAGTALRALSFEVPVGQTVALVGESGCGKSLTAKSLLRILPKEARISAGAIHLAGTDIAALPPRDPRLQHLRGGEIGMIYQEPMTALSGFYTIGNQIEETLRQHGASKRAARARAVEVLKAVGLPAGYAESYSFELSGGQRQRAMIAMALSTKPRLLIADEPTTALDVTTQAIILDLLRRLQAERGMAMLFITHDLSVVAHVADRAVVMYLGEVVEQGPVRRILKAPQHPYTRALIASVPSGSRGRLAAIEGTVPQIEQRPEGCAFAARCPSAAALCHAIAPPLIDRAEGHQVRCHAFSGGPVTLEDPTLPDRAIPADRIGRPILRAEGLSMHFHRSRGVFRKTAPIEAVSDVTLELRERETLAVVGESGSGKTTLGRSLIGLHRATAGSVALHTDRPRDLTAMSATDRRAAWRDMRMVFQDPFSSLNGRMTVFDIVADPLRRAGERRPAQKVFEALERVGLDPALANRYPHAFSGGQRQRIGIARALAPEPKIVILDEPVSALDVSVQAQVLNLLAELQAERGLSYLFISHDLNVVASVAHRVAVMYAGRIVEEAAATALFATPRHPYARALLASRLSPDPDAPRAPLPPAGAPPDPAALPPGCAFAPRCPLADKRCRAERPALAGTVHRIACHHSEAPDAHLS